MTTRRSNTLALHIIRPLPASLVNRDRTNQTKTIYLGGSTRVRVSSQAVKRAMRLHFGSANLVDPENLSLRTRGLPRLLTAELKKRGRTDAEQIALHTVWGMGFLDRDPKNTSKRQSTVALFLGNSEVANIADAIDELFDGELATAMWPIERLMPTEAPETAVAKKDLKAECPPQWSQLGAAARRALDPSKSIDIALFGRFLAEDRNIDVTAAVSVAHAFSTDPMEITQDFFTAVDDLAQAEDAGSGFAYGDTTPLTAPTMYEHTTLNVDTLRDNLGDNEELVERAIRAWVDAALRAVPMAKGTGTAHHTLPSMVVAVSTTGQASSLAKAFNKAVEPTARASVLDQSVLRLARQWSADAAAYGTKDVRSVYNLHTLIDADETVFAELGERVNAETLADRLVAQALTA